LTLENDAIALHRILKGKIGIQSMITPNFGVGSSVTVAASERAQGPNQSREGAKRVNSYGVLELIYTPGVAAIADTISRNNELASDYTSKWNNVAIVCDGTRVLGIGNIGPQGALPVMEGKSELFKLLGDINTYPMGINTTDKEEIIGFVKAVEPTFGAINIEAIDSPKVLEIVERLQKELPIPVFHDDQHGTSIVALAAVLNALKIVNKPWIAEVKVVIAGAGSAGYGISKILMQVGCNQILVIDSQGTIYQNRPERMYNKYKQELSSITNPTRMKDSLEDAIVGADVFIGVSGKPNILDGRMVTTMNNDPIIFALSNPEPEIHPLQALANGVKVVATGRSDFHNQINNISVFP
jgi:malate dehydrogenase (oxaloacetate-decarboxylating)